MRKASVTARARVSRGNRGFRRREQHRSFQTSDSGMSAVFVLLSTARRQQFEPSGNSLRTSSSRDCALLQRCLQDAQSLFRSSAAEGRGSPPAAPCPGAPRLPSSLALDKTPFAITRSQTSSITRKPTR